MVITLPAGVPAGSTVLLLPRGTGDAADEACLRVLGGDDPQRREVVALTIARSAEAFVDSWIDHVGVEPADMRVVDVGTDARSVAAEPADRPSSRNVVRPAGDLRDLDRIRAHVEELLAGPIASDADRLLYLDALSTDFRELGPEATIGFLGDVRDLVRRTGSYGLVRVDRSAHSDHTIDVMTNLVDVVLGSGVGERGGRPWTIRTGRRAPEGSGEGDQTPSLDDRFELLSDRRRRLAVHYLSQAEGSMTTRELTRRIAGVELPGDDTPEDEALQRIYTGLVHVHLPKLAQHGVVSVDAGGESIRLREPAEHLRPLLALTVTDDLRG